MPQIPPSPSAHIHVARANEQSLRAAAQVHKGPISDRFCQIASGTAHAAGRPAVFIFCFLIIIAWAVSGPIFGYSDTWQLIINTGTTIVTFLMVFLIQNTQNRDGAALQAKLDELIRAHHEARNTYIGIERLTEEELEQLRTDLAGRSGVPQCAELRTLAER